jgi:hypothetical protein
MVMAVVPSYRPSIDHGWRGVHRSITRLMPPLAACGNCLRRLPVGWVARRFAVEILFFFLKKKTITLWRRRRAAAVLAVWYTVPLWNLIVRLGFSILYISASIALLCQCTSMFASTVVFAPMESRIHACMKGSHVQTGRFFGIIVLRVKYKRLIFERLKD